MYLLKLKNERHNQDPEDILDSLISDPSTPNRLTALNRICEADKELISKVMYCIDTSRMEVDWYSVFNMDYSDSGYAGLVWAKSIWDGKTMNGKDLFSLLKQMTDEMKIAVLEGASFAWNIRLCT